MMNMRLWSLLWFFFTLATCQLDSAGYHHLDGTIISRRQLLEHDFTVPLQRRGTLLYKRKDLEEGPLDHIRLEKDPSTPETIDVRQPDGSLRQVQCFGSYCAMGTARGPVNKQQFIEKTAELAGEVKEKWDNAAIEQKYAYDDFKNPVTGKLEYQVRMNPVTKEPAMSNLPMSGGQATGTSDNVRFDFATQDRPANEYKNSPEAQRAFSQTYQKQLDKYDPENGQHGPKIAEANRRKQEANRAAGRLFRESETLTDPAEKERNDAEKRKLDEIKTTARDEINERTKKQNDYPSQCTHKFDNHCAESKLISETLPREGSLKDAWQVAWGTRTNHQEYGPQAACSEKDNPAGKEHGCAENQRDLKIVDLYPTAKALDEWRKGNGPKPADEELQLCKRGDTSCPFNTKTGEIKPPAPVTGATKEETTNTQSTGSNVLAVDNTEAQRDADQVKTTPGQSSGAQTVGDEQTQPATDQQKTSTAKAGDGQTDVPTVDQTKADQTKADQMKADQPKAEQPKANQPKANQPKANLPEVGQSNAGPTQPTAAKNPGASKKSKTSTGITRQVSTKSEDNSIRPASPDIDLSKESTEQTTNPSALQPQQNVQSFGSSGGVGSARNPPKLGPISTAKPTKQAMQGPGRKPNPGFGLRPSRPLSRLGRTAQINNVKQSTLKAQKSQMKRPGSSGRPDKSAPKLRQVSGTKLTKQPTTQSQAIPRLPTQQPPRSSSTSRQNNRAGPTTQSTRQPQNLLRSASKQSATSPAASRQNPGAKASKPSVRRARNMSRLPSQRSTTSPSSSGRNARIKLAKQPQTMSPLASKQPATLSTPAGQAPKNILAKRPMRLPQNAPALAPNPKTRTATSSTLGQVPRRNLAKQPTQRSQFVPNLPFGQAATSLPTLQETSKTNPTKLSKYNKRSLSDEREYDYRFSLLSRRLHARSFRALPEFNY